MIAGILYLVKKAGIRRPFAAVNGPGLACRRFSPENGVNVEFIFFIGGYRSHRLSIRRKQPSQLERQSFPMIEESKVSAFLRPLNRAIVDNRRVVMPKQGQVN